MTPTNKLRFVERKAPMHPFYQTVGSDGQMREGVQTYRVLQQWWTAGPLDALSVQLGTNGEWRDVPMEVEE